MKQPKTWLIQMKLMPHNPRFILSFSTESIMKYARVAMFSLQMTFKQRPSKSKGH